MSFALSVVMDGSAALLNDVAKTDYTYAAQLPYVAIALAELQEEFELNDIPVVNNETAAIVLPAGTATSIGFNTTPALPPSLIEIQQAWERLSGSNEPFIPMTKVNFLPHYLETEIVDVLVYWSWENQTMLFLGSTVARDIKLDYMASLFPQTVTSATVITTINTQTFLTYRNAGLCAEFIAENKSRADELNQFAAMAMDRALGIPTKGRQAIGIRRRPFRASYRSRQIW